jgi:hypothetical protein
MEELCRPVNIYCDTLGFRVSAGDTKQWDETPGVPFTTAATNYRTPDNIKSFKLVFKEAKYHVKWHFSLLKPKPSDDLSYEDESVSIKFSLAPDGISCNLRNKTSDPVTINWNNVSWVDYSGEAHKLIHSGVRLVDKEAPQPPTVIPPLARIAEAMFPADHVKSTSSGWSKESLWPDLVDTSGEQSHLKKLEGAMFSVFMPLEIQGKTKNYSFIFTTKSVEY